MYYVNKRIESERSKKIHCHGCTAVDSPWSDGWRETDFTVSLDPSGKICWEADKGSRTPYFEDVLESLKNILDEEHIQPLEGLETFKEENCVGVKYTCVVSEGVKYSLGVDKNFKLSTRGVYDVIPAMVLATLMRDLEIPKGQWDRWAV